MEVASAINSPTEPLGVAAHTEPTRKQLGDHINQGGSAPGLEASTAAEQVAKPRLRGASRCAHALSVIIQAAFDLPRSGEGGGLRPRSRMLLHSLAVWPA
jgi:hypothetical protein